LPEAVRAKIIKDTKKSIKKLKRANGFKDEKESREALEDPDASEYMKFVVSGDEDSDATVLGDEGGEEERWVDGEGQGSACASGEGGEGGENMVVGDAEGVNGENTREDGGEQDGDNVSYYTAGEVNEEEN
jgi:hypothetical protein